VPWRPDFADADGCGENAAMNWRQSPLRQLPNLITILRMLSVLPLLWWLHHGDYRLALGIALIAGVSDGLDGWLAKRFGWRTWLGSVLDPIADKLLLDCSFVGLWLAHGPGFEHAAPLWLVLMVLGRDAVIVAGASAYHFLIGPVKGQPTVLGKISTVAQIVLVLGLLCDLAWRSLPEDVTETAIWIVAALTLASGLDYVVRWSLKTRHALRERAR
jgi:cardiolipin synthase